MPTIRILEDNLINKISAGEVIERPSSVVKELLENSIDSGADIIRVEIKKGGTKLIRVTDNGCGMTPEDAALSIKRHATSKISSFEDLYNIKSLGFRGEALPSIASVSKMTVVTKTEKDAEGAVLKLEGNKKTDTSACGAAKGTTVTVEDLFFNTPARLKFLKTLQTETAHITSLFQQLAIPHNKISFELVSDDKKLTGPLPKGQSPVERLASIYGTEFTAGIMPVRFENNFIKLSGYLVKPDLTYTSSKHQFFYVNKRHISSRLISHAVTEGYGTFLDSRRYPGVFLFMDINPDLIDVNIHPAKKEIRFVNENAVHSLIASAIKAALNRKNVVPGMLGRALSEKHFSPYEAPLPIQEILTKKEFLKDVKFDYRQKRESAETFRSREFTQALPVTQVLGTYLITQEKDGVTFIDQHAAWERINYETLKKGFARKEVPSQTLLLPVNIELAPQQSLVLKKNLEFFYNTGFSMEEFGERAFIIKAVPAFFAGNNDFKELVSDMLDMVSDSKEFFNGADRATGKIDDIFKLMACKASVKAGDYLSPRETAELLTRLNECDEPYTCPHGRPTMIKIDRAELEKRFKRK